jgi:hypothetical protein
MSGRGELYLQDILQLIRRCGSFRLHLFERLSARVPFILISFYPFTYFAMKKKHTIAFRFVFDH